MSEYWTAKQTAHPSATADGWALVYNPTPGGKQNADGTTSYSLRFPALLICDIVSDPEATALKIANMLNRAEAIQRDEERRERK